MKIGICGTKCDICDLSINKNKKMKKLLLCFIASGMLFSSSINAQREANQVVVTAGVGYSLGMQVLKGALNTSLTAAGLEKIKGTPIINGMVDYGLTENFSLGGAYSFHKWNWSDSYTDTAGVITTGSASIQRQNIAGRALFHFGNNEKVDLYAGARVGTSLWKITADGANSNGDSASDVAVPSGVFSVQALFGVRTYFTDVFGANFEFGIGSAPYFVAGGLSFKF